MDWFMRSKEEKMDWLQWDKGWREAEEWLH